MSVQTRTLCIIPLCMDEVMLPSVFSWYLLIQQLRQGKQLGGFILHSRHFGSFEWRQLDWNIHQLQHSLALPIVAGNAARGSANMAQDTKTTSAQAHRTAKMHKNVPSMAQCSRTKHRTRRHSTGHSSSAQHRGTATQHSTAQGTAQGTAQHGRPT